MRISNIRRLEMFGSVIAGVGWGGRLQSRASQSDNRLCYCNGGPLAGWSGQQPQAFINKLQNLSEHPLCEEVVRRRKRP